MNFDGLFDLSMGEVLSLLKLLAVGAFAYWGGVLIMMPRGDHKGVGGIREPIKAAFLISLGVGAFLVAGSCIMDCDQMPLVWEVSGVVPAGFVLGIVSQWVRNCMSLRR